MVALVTLALVLAPSAASAQPGQQRSSVVVVKSSAPTPAPAPAPAPPPAAAPALMPRAAPPTPAPPVVPPAATAAPTAGPRILPWVTLAGSVAAGIAGGVFMGKAISAANQELTVEVKANGTGTQTVTLPPEFQDQQTRILTNGVVGTVLLSTATAGAIASLISLLSN